MTPAEREAFDMVMSIGGISEADARRYVTSTCKVCGRRYLDHGITPGTAGNDCGEFTPGGGGEMQSPRINVVMLDLVEHYGLPRFDAMHIAADLEAAKKWLIRFAICVQRVPRMQPTEIRAWLLKHGLMTAREARPE